MQCLNWFRSRSLFFWHCLDISYTIPIPSLHFSLQPSVQHSSQTAFYISKEIFEGCRWWYKFLLYLFIKRSRKQERARVKFIWNSWSDAQLVTFLLLLAFLKVLQERLNHCQLACLPYLHVFHICQPPTSTLFTFLSVR